jgi:hypothetical protein
VLEAVWLPEKPEPVVKEGLPTEDGGGSFLGRWTAAWHSSAEPSQAATGCCSTEQQEKQRPLPEGWTKWERKDKQGQSLYPAQHFYRHEASGKDQVELPLYRCVLRCFTWLRA